MLFKLNKSLKSRHEVIPLPKFWKMIQNEWRTTERLSSAFLPYWVSLSVSCCCIIVCADPWNATFSTSRVGAAQHPSDAHRPQLPSGVPLTVKDLLLSGTSELVSAVWPWAAQCQRTRDAYFDAFLGFFLDASQLPSWKETIVLESVKSLILPAGACLSRPWNLFQLT